MRILRRMPALAWAVAALLAACQQPENEHAERAVDSTRYDRDRQYCSAQVSERMTTRRTIDDSRNEIFRGDRDRFGHGELPSQMAAYGDSRSYDQFMSDCMAARGWSQPSKSWWQKLGTGFRI